MTKEDVLNVLVEALSPEKKKVAGMPAYVLVVDGKVVSERPRTVAELTKAVRAITLRKPEAKISVYEYKGDVEVDLPVSGISALESAPVDEKVDEEKEEGGE